MCSSKNPDLPVNVIPLRPAAERTSPRFPLGQIVATPAVLAHFNRHQISPLTYLRRHAAGDWGEIPQEDVLENELSLVHGFRVMSAYTIAGERVWIITEADRSVTTLLFPSEY